MKVKIFQDTNTNVLESQVNDFIMYNDGEVVKIDFTANSGTFAVMVSYEDHARVKEKEDLF
jgi:hypothetical protein